MTGAGHRLVCIVAFVAVATDSARTTADVANSGSITEEATARAATLSAYGRARYVTGAVAHVANRVTHAVFASASPVAIGAHNATDGGIVGLNHWKNLTLLRSNACFGIGGDCTAVDATRNNQTNEEHHQDNHGSENTSFVVFHKTVTPK